MLCAALGEAGEEPAGETGDNVTAGVWLDKLRGSICIASALWVRVGDKFAAGRVSANSEATLKLLRRELVLFN